MIVIIANNKKNYDKIASKLSEVLSLLQEKFTIINDFPFGTSQTSLIKNSWLIIILGGDGTILHTVSAIRHFQNKFLLPIQLGSLSYIPGIKVAKIILASDKFTHYFQPLSIHEKNIFFQSTEQLITIFKNASLLHHSHSHSNNITSENTKKISLNKFLKNKIKDFFPTLDIQIKIVQRSILKIIYKNKIFYALNEALVSYNNPGKPTIIESFVNGSLLTRFLGNGVMATTPTGSTGYNLSAGGPIIAPSVNAYIFHPLLPHSFSLKPLILDAKDKLTIKAPKKTMLIIDGDKKINSIEDSIYIALAKEKINIIQSQDENHYNTLKKKLGWGASFKHTK